VGDGGREFTSCGLSVHTFHLRWERRQKCRRTLGETGTQETGDLLDETVGSKEGIVLASKLLDELLVLVQLLEVIGGHGINAVVLGTVEIVLVTKNTAIKLVSLSPNYFPFSLSVLVLPPRFYCRVDVPDGHARARHGRELDGTRETLVTLGVVVLQTDLELDGLEEVTLLLILRVVEQLLDILAHSGCRKHCQRWCSGSGQSRKANIPTVILDILLTVFQKNLFQSFLVWLCAECC
jgi:hypothetical protein